VNKERFLPHAVSALAIIALVVLTNEGYRHYRGIADGVSQAKRDIATLKRDLYVLQVQLDNRPALAPTPGATTQVGGFTAPVTYPMPAPIGPTLPLPDAAPPMRPKQQASDEQKSMVSVLLMSDAKVVAPVPVAGVKSNDGPKIDVQLISDSK
jgi:hypothetical protein